MGIAFGGVVAGAGIVVFNAYLRGTPTFASAAELMQRKVGAFGIDSAAKYFVLASFYSLFHSLLEEYYWRWFVFQQLRARGPARRRRSWFPAWLSRCITSLCWPFTFTANLG